jgi:hypothetical protein
MKDEGSLSPVFVAMPAEDPGSVEMTNTGALLTVIVSLPCIDFSDKFRFL